jgi:hypothetical protein
MKTRMNHLKCFASVVGVTLAMMEDSMTRNGLAMIMAAIFVVFVALPSAAEARGGGGGGGHASAHGGTHAQHCKHKGSCR